MKQSTPPALLFLEEGLAEARRGHLLRERPEPTDGAGLSFCSNDYLGLAREASATAASGAGASRLLGGDRPVHARLEEASARLVGLDRALVFSSGYGANLGLLSCLAGPEDVIVSDELNHASIIDGARLSRARVVVTPHLDVAAVDGALARGDGRRAFVVTESYFSMDADSPDLAALRGVCDRRGAALLVDEAHALGVLGPDGRGVCAEMGVRPDALVGTYGKAFGASGAFVAGCDALVQWLWNRARSFVFSTGISPALAMAALGGVRRAQAEPARRVRVLEAADRMRDGMTSLGLSVRGRGPILPWVLGEPEVALRAAERLRERGLDVRAVRPPTVPQGTARIRLTLTAAHETADIDRALLALAEVAP